MALDPSAEQVMHISSELMQAREVVAKQRRVIWSLVAALRSAQVQQAALQDLVDAILAADS